MNTALHEFNAKARILRSAEKLFADHGIDSVSLRDVAIHAGQKNTNAVQYHFGSKAELIRAIWQRHAQGIEQTRAALLGQLPANPDLQSVVTLLVTPVLAKLNDADGGREYLLIMSQLVSNPKDHLLKIYETLPETSMIRIMEYLDNHSAHLPETDRNVRSIFVMGMLFHGIADFIRLKEAKASIADKISHDDLKRNLANTIASVITAA